VDVSAATVGWTPIALPAATPPTTFKNDRLSMIVSFSSNKRLRELIYHLIIKECIH
jgi:hypothetical protein